MSDSRPTPGAALIEMISLERPPERTVAGSGVAFFAGPGAGAGAVGREHLVEKEKFDALFKPLQRYAHRTIPRRHTHCDRAKLILTNLEKHFNLGNLEACKKMLGEQSNLAFYYKGEDMVLVEDDSSYIGALKEVSDRVEAQLASTAAPVLY